MMLWYVTRNAGGNVRGLFAAPQTDPNIATDPEPLAESHADVVAFLNPQPSVEDLKAQLAATVDADAEAARLRYITPGAGMALTYQEKHAQARAVLTMGDTAANALTEEERDDQFPTLSASVGLEAETLYACAQLVVARYEAFADLSRVIERTRLAGKKSISDASDAAAARAAYEAITWTV